MQKSTLALRFGAALLAAVCVSDAARADAVRVLAPAADGAPEETTFEGKIASVSADEIVLDVDGQKRTLAAASVLGTQYDDEPIVLAACVISTYCPVILLLSLNLAIYSPLFVKGAEAPIIIRQ